MRRQNKRDTSYKGRAVRYLVAQAVVSRLQLNHIYDGDGKKLSIDSLINGQEAEEKWLPALSNELGRLAQGNTRVQSTDTIDFIPYSKVPSDSKVTYASFLCDHNL